MAAPMTTLMLQLFVSLPIQLGEFLANVLRIL